MKRVALLTLGILIAFFSTEYIVRYFAPQITVDSILTPWEFSCFTKGSYSWVRLKPNAHCILHSNTNAFPDISVKTNSLGLRNGKIAPKKPGVIRILVIGDSFTMGWGEKEQDSYPRVTETLLQKLLPTKDIEVINAGIPATGTGVYYTFLTQIGLALKPDIVIIGLYPYSDIAFDDNGDIQHGKDNLGLPTFIESQNAYVETLTGTIRYKTMPTKFKIPLLRHSHLAAMVFDRLFPWEHLSTAGDAVSAKPCFFKSQCHDLDTAWEKTFTLLAGIRDQVNKANATLIVMVIPSEMQLHPETAPKYGILIPLLPWDLQVPNKKLRTFFEQNNIAFLDLLTSFASRSADVLYHPFDDHWNTLGHQAAAQDLAEKIKEHIN